MHSGGKEGKNKKENERITLLNRPGSEINHHHYLHLALSQAKLSPAKPTNFSVGAVVVSPSISSTSPPNSPDPSSPNSLILARGHTSELPGNTHAEQVCLEKLCSLYAIPSSSLSSLSSLPSDVLPNDLILYTTMEPCSHRLSGNLPCTDRIIQAGKISTVVIGVAEPDTFVSENTGRKKLRDAGIEVLHISGLEAEILKVATAGHVTR